jgi:hypothetical protein
MLPYGCRRAAVTRARGPAATPAPPSGHTAARGEVAFACAAPRAGSSFDCGATMDVTALAALAGNTVVAAAVTDAFEGVRGRVARLFGRGKPRSPAGCSTGQ